MVEPAIEEASIDSSKHSMDGEHHACWEVDISLLNEGQRLLFTNDIKGAEILFTKGAEMRSEPCSQPYSQYLPEGAIKNADHNIYRGISAGSVAKPVPGSGYARDGAGNEAGGDGTPDQDMRAAFRLMHALTCMLGAGSALSTDQMDKSIALVWKAEEFANHGQSKSSWVGHSQMRDICFLLGGAMQCLRGKYAAGVINLVRCISSLGKVMDEAKQYDGKERSVIVSCAQFLDALFNLVVSALPKKYVTTASFFTGFEGDREKALEVLVECNRENGLFAPWAGLFFLVTVIDAMSFLDVTPTEKQFQNCIDIFQWAEERYPGSYVFKGIRAELYSVKLQPQKALSTMHELMDTLQPGQPMYAVFHFAALAKSSFYVLPMFHWDQMIEYCKRAIQCLKDSDSVALVPSFTLQVMILYAVVENRDAAQEWCERFRLLKGQDQERWGRQDKTALYNFENRFQESVPPKNIAFLEIIEQLVYRSRKLQCVTIEDMNVLFGQLEEVRASIEGQNDAMIRARCCLFLAEICATRDRIQRLLSDQRVCSTSTMDTDLSLSYIKQGLDESKEVTKDYAPKILLLLTKAKMLMRLDKFPESRRAIDLAESQPSSGAQSLLEPVWQFRIGPLQRRLDLTWANIYQSHEVPSGSSVTWHYDVHVKNEGDGFSYELGVLAHSIVASVAIGMGSEIVQKLENKTEIKPNKEEEEAGPAVVRGTRVFSKAECPRSFRVLIKFDNGFSYWRNKSIFRRVQAVGGAEVTFLEDEDDALSDSDVASSREHFDSVSEDPSKTGELAPAQDPGEDFESASEHSS